MKNVKILYWCAFTPHWVPTFIATRLHTWAMKQILGPDR